MSKYKVVIPTAGTGSRLGKISANLNKSLVAVAGKPIISHIVEKFPEDIEFVIPIGYKGDLVQEFLSLAYPKRKFSFVTVSPYEGEGSGLGLSLLLAKEELQCPFVFCSCDTIVAEAIPGPESNWMAYTNSGGYDLKQYRTLELKDNNVIQIVEKGIIKDNIAPYIGLAGIKDYKLFWEAMAKDQAAISTGESHGLRELIKSAKTIEAKAFTWYDTGVPEELSKTREALKQPNSPNILEKATEAIWFVSGSVIKFSTDTKFISDRVKRTQVLGAFVPEVNASTTHMYRYNEVPGQVLSETVNIPIFKDFLKHSQAFWSSPVIKAGSLSTQEQERFQETCMKFYKNKTLERIEKYYNDFKQKDLNEIVNGYQMPLMQELLEQVDWDCLAKGKAGNFHGDFHFENIIYNPEGKDSKFAFLDWRQEFGGVIEYGDIYYDFGKLNHGLIVSHEIINHDLYTVKFNGQEPKNVDVLASQKLVVDYDLHRKQILVECENYFRDFIIEAGYDYKKTYTMTALIYLNIAGLHHYPYCHLLYFLGKTMLQRGLKL